MSYTELNKLVKSIMIEIRFFIFVLGVLVAFSTQAQTERILLTAIEKSRLGEQGRKDNCEHRVMPKAEWKMIGDRSEPRILARFVTEGCGGGNYWGVSVGVFGVNGAQYYLADFRHIEGSIETYDVSGSTIVIKSLGYNPGDARCCPSKKTTQKLRWDGKRLLDLN